MPGPMSTTGTTRAAWVTGTYPKGTRRTGPAGTTDAAGATASRSSLTSSGSARSRRAT